MSMASTPKPILMKQGEARSNLPRRADAAFNWSLVVAVNNEQVLKNTLLASPAIGAGCELIVRRGYACAGKAYNSGLAEARNEIVVFAHQDVYLPDTWVADLQHALHTLEANHSRWGVLGCFGVTRDLPRQPHGHCYSTGLRNMLGKPFSTPVPAGSLDELLLVVRRSSHLSFDEQLSGFHLYGTDICLEASLRGMNSYIIPAFCVHNSNGIVRLPSEFWRAYFYLRRKWRGALPIATCCTTISVGCLPFLHRKAVECKERLLPRAVGRRSEDVAALYEELRRSCPELCTSLARN